ncbi:MAG: chromosome segregation SMC family protein [Candidatus Micrarchaeaceae archaeon]
MLYIKSLTLDRFKSFRHADLLFNKGFNAIVGSNGSGKSNICDALLFCLGESSLHRLRANKLEDLIHSDGKKSPAAKAYVRLEFGGDDNITITRSLGAEGKSAYIVNGKHITRQDVVELLSSHRIYADERNTIAQGEIAKITELNSKERRELIDTAAGIMEFERKKAEALKELDKVNMKISEMQGVLQERLGFLRELEKEKEAAESYYKLAARLKQLNYSTLLARISATRYAIEAYEKDIEALQAQKASEDANIKKLNELLSVANAERQELTRSIEESTKHMGSVNERMQKIGAQLAESSAKIENYAARIETLNAEELEKQEALKEIEQRIKSNEGAVLQLEKELELLGASLPKGSRLQELREIKELNERTAGLEEREKELRDGVAKLDTERALRASKKESALAELNSIKEKLGSLQEERRRLEEAAALSRSSHESSAKEIDKQARTVSELEKSLEEKGSKALELKEQRAMSSQSESQVKESLLRAFGPSSGVYGALGDLLEYSEQYAKAVEAAAGSRLDYIVVDTIDTAEKAIAYLKLNGIGRATFIPIREIRVAQGKTVDAKPLLSVISYDKKFEKAIAYVFGNAYIVESLQEAKALGIGLCRYVTLDGSLAETSGLVSGGSAKKQRLPLHSINNALKQLEHDISQLSAERHKAEAKLFELRKSAAAEEIRLGVLSDSMANVSRQQAELERRKAEIEKEISEQEALEAKAESQRSELETAREALAKELADSRARLKELYSLLGSAEAQAGQLSSIEGKQKSIEGARIRIAELKKENQMLSAKAEDTKGAIAKALRERENALRMLEKERSSKEGLEKEKGEIESQIRNSGEAYRKAYDRINELEQKAIETSKQIGESATRSKELDSKIKDMQIKKGQLEVRMNDLKAELAAYEKGIEPIKDMSIEDLEKEASAVSMRIQELGTVNMKAPEVYALKKQEVDEAQSKLETLETERRAVLGLIDEVDKKKLSAFMSAFGEIEKNFEKMYKYIFPGEARLVLENEKDPFSSGLEIRTINANRQGALATLSGGEKAIVSLMLNFAIHMYKPASLYIFDEIDASLDKENSKKLSLLIKELSKDAQFIVVSHNDTLILNAGAAIGVIKSNGVSKVVGVELSSIKGKAEGTSTTGSGAQVVQ